MQIVLISGLSGSGKSIALNVLEDAGYYVVDNLPAALLPQLVAHLRGAGWRRVAVAVDMRSGVSIAALPQQVEALRATVRDLRVIFLEARDDALIARFSETRRRHPLAIDDVTLEEAIQRERDALESIAALGHRIDTSDLHPNTLRAWVKDFVQMPSTEGMTLMFESFGFKYGIPLDADLVFDVRCLPNPHYDPQLRPLTGRPAGDRVPGEDPRGPAHGAGHPPVHRQLAARLPARQPQLPDGGDRLHRWPAPLGVSRRMAGRAFS